MKSLSVIVTVLVISMLIPSAALPQSRDDIVRLQRDLAGIEGRMRTLESKQDERFAALEAMISQVVSSTSGLSAAISALDQKLEASIAEQQRTITGLAEPIARLGSRLDQTALDSNAVREEIAAMNRRMTSIEDLVKNIDAAVTTLNTPAYAPPPPGGNEGEVLWQSATSDFSAGEDDLAMTAFQQYYLQYPDSERAPQALYYMGMIYVRAMDYTEAIKAFDRVDEQFPENPVKTDALMAKADALVRAGRNADAIQVYNNFLQRYPNDSKSALARDRLRQLQ